MGRSIWTLSGKERSEEVNETPFRFAVLTISDRASNGIYEDQSGPALVEHIQGTLGASLVEYACIPDDEERIVDQLSKWARHSPTIDLIVTTGGTGLSPRDRTPEAAMRVLDRPHPGLLELARLRTSEITDLAFLSRGVAGAAKNSLIITLPGSPKGAIEQLNAIGSILPHALSSLRGDSILHESNVTDLRGG